MTWILLIVVLTMLAVWLFFNLSPAQRDCFNHRLLVEDAQTAEFPSGTPVPGVAIICPGRNEAEWIDKTLPDLCLQDYPNTRVIFIDDHSDDATIAITAQMDKQYKHLTVVRNEMEPPAGWVGKCWAVRQGYASLQAASDQEEVQWLCFTDADIRWHPQCLRAAMNYGRRFDADVVALFPKLEFGSTSERLGQITMVLALGLLFPFKKAMDPKHPHTLTGGAFILVKRDIYDSIGGHESVKGCVVEDLNLGKNLKAAGAKIRIAVTPELLTCRMYDGWSDMWEGLTKNAYAGMEYHPTWAAGFLGAAWIANVFAPLYVVLAIVWSFNSPGDWRAWVTLGASIGIVLLQARAMNGVRKLLGLRWWWAWSIAPGSALYSLFVVASMWRYYRGGNVWKGRSYNKSALANQAD